MDIHFTLTKYTVYATWQSHNSTCETSTTIIVMCVMFSLHILIINHCNHNASNWKQRSWAKNKSTTQYKLYIHNSMKSITIFSFLVIWSVSCSNLKVYSILGWQGRAKNSLQWNLREIHFNLKVVQLASDSYESEMGTSIQYCFFTTPIVDHSCHSLTISIRLLVTSSLFGILSRYTPRDQGLVL